MNYTRSRGSNGPARVSTSGSLYWDDKHERGSKRRGLRDLIHRPDSARQAARRRSRAPSDEPFKAQDRESNPQLSPGALCPRKIDDKRCWSANGDDDAQDRLRARVDSILRSHDHELFQRDRRALSSLYYEVYFLGQNLQTAHPTVVISCTSEEDKERVRKVIKKCPHVPDHDKVAILATLGSPRTSVPLIKLASRSRSYSATDEEIALIVGARVFSNVEPDGSLSIPATIWVGENWDSQHQATLGGLISTVTEPALNFGLTIAHTSTSNATKDTEPPHDSSRTAIGHLSSVSKSGGTRSLEWALVKLFKGIHTQTSIPPPTFVQRAPKGPTTIKVLTARGVIRGTISESVTFINSDGTLTSTKTRPVVTDQPMRSGDCGAWVVGPDTELYGQVAYGHEGEKLAYIISAADVIKEIEENYQKVQLSTVISSTLREAGIQGERPQTPVPDGLQHKPTIRQIDADRQSYSGVGKHQRIKERVRRRVTPRSRKEERQKNLKSFGLFVACMVFLGIIAVLYFSVSAYAYSANSEVGHQTREKLAALMAQTMDEMTGQVRKQTEKFDSDASQNTTTVKQQVSTHGVEHRSRKSNLPPSTPLDGTVGETKSPFAGFRKFWHRLHKRQSKSKVVGHQSITTAARQTDTNEPNADPSDPVEEYIYRYSYSDDGLSHVSEPAKPETIFTLGQTLYDGFRNAKDRRQRRQRSRRYDSDDSTTPRNIRTDRYSRTRRYDDSDDDSYTRRRSRSRSRSRSRRRHRLQDSSLIEYGGDPVYSSTPAVDYDKQAAATTQDDLKSSSNPYEPTATEGLGPRNKFVESHTASQIPSSSSYERKDPHQARRSEESGSTIELPLNRDQG